MSPIGGSTDRKYWDEIAAPFISKELRQSGGPFLCGKQFTAADCIVGFMMLVGLKDKMKSQQGEGWISPEHTPGLDAYVECLRSRPAFQLAVAPIPEKHLVDAASEEVPAIFKL
eukprot:g61060.t1